MQLQVLLKNQRLPVERGYSLRSKEITGIILHSTNGRGNSTFQAEENYLFSSPNVSAHYLVGTDSVTQFLDPKQYVAYHAGYVNNEKYSNAQSIGVEVHYSPKDTYPVHKDKIINLTNLVQNLLKEYNLNPNDITMHRSVAIYPPDYKVVSLRGKLGRKPDPSFWTNEEFETWRKSLLTQEQIVNTILNGPQVDTIYLYRALNAYTKLPVTEKDLIVSAYTAYGELTTIGNLYPFCQAAKETAWFSSERFVKSRNMAGLGATNDGSWGGHFNNISEGVLAQYAHLLCYATKPENTTFLLERIALLSPRYAALAATHGRGCATTWRELDGRWAVPGKDYSESIFKRADSILKL